MELLDLEFKWFDYDIIQPNYKFKTCYIQASLGISQLKRINLFLNYRKNVAKLYEKNFNGMEFQILPGILIMDMLIIFFN